MTITLEIPEEIMLSTKLSPDELLTELAVALYASRRLSSGKASELANMSLWQFRQLTAARGITVNLDITDFDDEVATLKSLGLV